MPTTRFRILLLHDAAILGGAERSIELLAVSLDRARFEPVVGLCEPGPFHERLKTAGIRVLRVELARIAPFHPIRWLLGARRLAQVIRAEGIALVHGNTPRSNLYAWLAARLAGVPVIWQMRNVLEPGMWDVERVLQSLPDRIVCNSEAVRARFGPASPQRGPVVIHTGVDTVRFRPLEEAQRGRVRRELGLGNEIAVALVGRISHKQGQEEFIRAARLISDKRPDFRFFIVGGAPRSDDRQWERRCRDLARELSLEKTVSFLGHRDDPERLMPAMDVLAFPSRFEAFSRGVLEAMSCGVPVVAANVGGMPEAVDDGKTGRLVPPLDPDALAAAVLEAAEPANRREWGTAARKRAAQRFSAQSTALKMQDVYLDLLEPRRP